LLLVVFVFVFLILLLCFLLYCSEDDVYLPSEILLQEYIMRDYGFVYKGRESVISSWPWNYGQVTPSPEGAWGGCVQAGPWATLLAHAGQLTGAQCEVLSQFPSNQRAKGGWGCAVPL
jgi:hypothetical protein